jgi:uncharacterized protein YndB with AHSA1/START domain
MKTHTTIKDWARDNNIRVTRFNQDHTLDTRYRDVVPTVHLELTLDADKSGLRPHLRIWIPLARRTPLFAFGPDAAKPEVTDVDATFPSFDTTDELVAALDTVHQDFLAHYGAQQPQVACSLS